MHSDKILSTKTEADLKNDKKDHPGYATFKYRSTVHNPATLGWYSECTEFYQNREGAVKGRGVYY
jgi:hypothetical protein